VTLSPHSPLPSALWIVSRPRRGGKLCLEVDLHEDDLREIALRGYEDAASPDRTLQAEAVTLYLPWVLTLVVARSLIGNSGL
jgi:hypothetical protein